MIEEETLLKRFSEQGGDARKAQIFFAPGRVCLIGEHIDYNGGLVLPAALSLGIYAVFAGDDSRTLKMRSGLSTDTVSIQRDEEIVFQRENGWANYPAGVLGYLRERGFHIPGGRLLFVSDLPVGAGLSSSAAIEVLTAFLFTSLEEPGRLTKVELAKLCKRVENDFIGVQCGIMDQFAVTMGRKNHAIMLNCNSLAHKYIPFETGEYSFLIFNTNKKRELTESMFNQRVSECREALASIQKHKQVENLADADEESVEAYVKNPLAKKRALHVVQENQRVKRAADFLIEGNVRQFGELLFQSNASLRNQYEVTGNELDAFQDAAISHPGCIGAKMSGAGFGGCALAIVEKAALADFKESVLQKYYLKTNLQGEFYEALIDDGVRRIR